MYLLTATKANRFKLTRLKTRSIRRGIQFCEKYHKKYFTNKTESDLINQFLVGPIIFNSSILNFIGLFADYKTARQKQRHFELILSAPVEI